MDAAAAARLAKLDEALKQTRSDYQDRDRLRGDVASLLTSCHTLQPRSGSFSSAGRTVELFYLYGVLPISYKGSEYNVPVTIYFDQPYPKQPPRCFVTPSPGMALKKGHQHVDDGGMIHLPYLLSWKEHGSSLGELVRLVTAAFSAAPPVYATTGATPPRTQPSVASGARLPAYAERPSTAASSAAARSRTPTTITRARRDVLVQDVTQAIRERWHGALEPVLGELQQQLEQQELLSSGDPSGLLAGGDAESAQVAESLAEELALDELLVALDELLAAKKISLEDFLREVRDVGRRQFLCRAQRLKSAQVAASGGAS